MSNTLTDIVEKMEKDIIYHASQAEIYPEGSVDWNFHLGWVDALTSYRYKLKEILEQALAIFEQDIDTTL